MGATIDNESTTSEPLSSNIWESPAQFDNRIKPGVYVRGIMRGTMYEKAPFR